MADNGGGGGYHGGGFRGNGGGKGGCYKCGRVGHIARNCPGATPNMPGQGVQPNTPSIGQSDTGTPAHGANVSRSQQVQSSSMVNNPNSQDDQSSRPRTLNNLPTRASGSGAAPGFQSYSPRAGTFEPSASQSSQSQLTSQQPGQNASSTRPARTVDGSSTSINDQPLNSYACAERLQFVPVDLNAVLQRVEEHALELVDNPPQPKLSKEEKEKSTDDAGDPTGATETHQKATPNLSAPDVAGRADLAKFQYGLRSSFGIKGMKTEVTTNYFPVTTPKRIHVYAVTMVRETDAQNRDIEVRKKADKLLVMARLREVVNQLTVVPRTWVHDGSMIWSTKSLWPSQPVGTMVWTSPALGVTYANEMGSQLTLERVDIKYIHDIDLAQPVGQLMYDGSDTVLEESVPSVLIRGLNAFFTDRVNQDGNSIVSIGGNRSFEEAVGWPLEPVGNRSGNHHLRALKGFSLSTRPGNDMFLLNINTGTSPFFDDLTVADFITKAQASGKDRREIFALLRGAKVKITYTTIGDSQKPGRNKIRFITELFHGGPSACILDPAKYPGTTLEKYYGNGKVASAWRTDLEYPRPPINLNARDVCVNVGKARQPSNTRNPNKGTEWYPASYLRIVQWQPVRGTLSGDETSAMIKVALRSPQANANMLLRDQTLQDGLSHFGFSDQGVKGTQHGLADFGMSVDTRLLKIPGRFLTTPSVTYGSRNTNRPGPVMKIEDASWNLRQTRFSRPGSVSALPILNLASCSPNVLQEIKTQMTVALRSSGMLAQNAPAFPNAFHAPSLPGYQVTAACEQNLRGELGRWGNSHTVLVLLSQKSFDVYATIKRVADLMLGVNTVCAAKTTVTRKDNRSNQVFPAFDQQKAANLALKFNIKGAGENHMLKQEDFASLTKIDNDGDIDTIVLGADVAHPGSGATPGCPSIACVVGTVDDNFMLFPGSMRLQINRQEGIEELDAMVYERLLDWSSKRRVPGKLPKRVLFYRDGVSESQYDQVRVNEIPQIQRAFNDARAYLQQQAAIGSGACTLSPEQGGPGDCPFQLTCAVVGKRHHTRFYPVSEKDSFIKSKRTGEYNGNVKPGLVVDQTITHPYAMDFFLQSHNPIQGTGRSAHYYVIMNNMRLSSDELQHITHSFCYAYARATRGVSYCAPAYYADRLCDRGRSYLRHWLTNRGHDQDKPEWRTRARNHNENPLAYKQAICQQIDGCREWRPFTQEHPNDPRATKYGRPRLNPWHPDLDEIMFYL